MISLNLLCASGTAARDLDRAQRDMPNNANLHITEYLNRIPIERAKWYLGYPLEKLRWLDD